MAWKRVGGDTCASIATSVLAELCAKRENKIRVASPVLKAVQLYQSSEHTQADGPFSLVSLAHLRSTGRLPEEVEGNPCCLWTC